MTTKYLTVNVIDDISKDKTRILSIDISTIEDIFASSIGLLVVKTNESEYFIKESYNDLSIQTLQLILRKTIEVDNIILKSPNGNKASLGMDDEYNLFANPI
jgi:hypothetical protein